MRSLLSTQKMETLTVVHLSVLGLVLPWIFGGGSPAGYSFACVAGSVAPIITTLAVTARHKEGLKSSTILLPLIPLAAFNLLVLCSLTLPGFGLRQIEGAAMLIPLPVSRYLPSAARPLFAAERLWLMDAILLSAFNLTLTIHRRKVLRLLLGLLAANALVLAVFGLFQKLFSAPGLFFGAVPSPNSTFFATFIYHNHWGAFVVLALAIGLAWLAHVRARTPERDDRHSPALAIAVGLFLLAATLPLCGTRSCTILGALLLAGALTHLLAKVIRHRNEHGLPVAGPVAAIVVGAMVALGTIGFLARPVIHVRLADTKAQLAHFRDTGDIGSRHLLYADTCRMIADRPLFGWGLGSYGTVFRNYNSQRAADHLPQYYADAHSDWLQIAAETGLAGLALLAAFAVLAFTAAWRGGHIASFPMYLLAGCGLIAAYAWIEFPFGNPAVSLLFWICFFAALRWIRIDRHS